MEMTGFKNNKWLLLWGFLLFSLMAQNGYAGEPSVVELKDGSIISGEVASFDGSTWVIRSASMGRLEIEASKVVSIRSQRSKNGQPATGASIGNQAASDQVQAMQQSIMANEQLMTMIMTLQNDPEVQAVLKDPDIMKAVNTNDISALLANPKFRRLMENARIKEITREAIK